MAYKISRFHTVNVDAGTDIASVIVLPIPVYDMSPRGVLLLIKAANDSTKDIINSKFYIYLCTPLKT